MAIPNAVLFAAVVVAVLPLAVGAHAECMGGPKIKGDFGANLGGPINSSNTAEEYSGILTSDGKCNLTGSLTGGVFGQASATLSVTGTYSVPANKQGSISLQLSAASRPVTFGIGLAKDGKAEEVTGVATSGPAAAVLDLVAMASKPFSLASLSGTYVSICTGASNSQSGDYGIELGYVTFDGAGHLSALAIGQNDGTAFSSTIRNATYQVDSDGSFTIQEPGDFARYTVKGEIVRHMSNETRSVLIDTTAGFGAYRSCVGKKQF